MLHRIANRVKLFGNNNRPLTLALKSDSINTIQKRFSGGGDEYYGYRRMPYDPNRKMTGMIAELSMGVIYWWITWNIISDWRHLIGEFILPEYDSWTDEYLGIPPDDDD